MLRRCSYENEYGQQGKDENGSLRLYQASSTRYPIKAQSYKYASKSLNVRI